MLSIRQIKRVDRLLVKFIHTLTLGRIEMILHSWIALDGAEPRQISFLYKRNNG